jgi:hypothetical protein
MGLFLSRHTFFLIFFSLSYEVFISLMNGITTKYASTVETTENMPIHFVLHFQSTPKLWRLVGTGWFPMVKDALKKFRLMVVQLRLSY